MRPSEEASNDVLLGALSELRTTFERRVEQRAVMVRAEMERRRTALNKAFLEALDGDQGPLPRSRVNELLIRPGATYSGQYDRSADVLDEVAPRDMLSPQPSAEGATQPSASRPFVKRVVLFIAENLGLRRLFGRGETG